MLNIHLLSNYFKYLLFLIFIIILSNPIFGYTITIKESVLGITWNDKPFFYTSTLIENISYIEIDGNYVHFEINEGTNIGTYLFPCINLLQITDNNGEIIPFNCDDLNKYKSIKLGETLINSKPNKGTNDYSRFNKNLKIEEIIVEQASYNRLDLTSSNIKIENDVVILNIDCRRTNIQSTLIKSYWLCGYAINQTNLFFSEIQVILNIETTRNTIITSANGSDVVELGKNKMNNYQNNKTFLENIDYYTIQNK